MTTLTLKSIAVAGILAFAPGLVAAPAQAASPAPANVTVKAETPLVKAGHRHGKKWRRHGGGFTFHFGDAPRRHKGFARHCTAQRAVHKASRWGVRHARVVNANHRIIKVRGRKHGHRVTIRFGRAPHCPVYSTR